MFQVAALMCYFDRDIISHNNMNSCDHTKKKSLAGYVFNQILSNGFDVYEQQKYLDLIAFGSGIS